jgi:hypothetical protein
MSLDSAAALSFPDGFLWGTATAAHQIEGGNVNNDWWQWEHNPNSGCADSSGDACDSFHRWPEDIDLVAAMGLGAYRFSLEWSRIEPAEGEFSVAALDHYRRMCAGCLERGIAPVVTFHHFTTPLWLMARGGWEAPDAPECFARFVARATAHLGDLIGWACTINEPDVIGVMGYTMGMFPPGVKDDFARHLAVNDGHGPGPPSGGGGAALGPRPVPGGTDPVHVGAEGGGGRRGRARRGRGHLGEHLSARRPGRRLHRRPVLHPDALRSPGPGSRRSGRGPDPDGLRVLAPGGRVHRAPGRRLHRDCRWW